ncbi:MAG: DUF1501 domain-containing protein [Planctomycetota bacterium]|nr:DUF1501 domain-containing protein [Planctomycetota bacterium]
MSLLQKTNSLSRRNLLSLGCFGLSSFGMGRPALASGPATAVLGKAKRVLLLFMDGGPSHIDLFDLKPDAPREIRGPCKPISTSVPGINIGEYFPKVAQQFHHICQIRSMSHKDVPHDQAVYHSLTGYRHAIKAGGLKISPNDHPHFASSFYRADPAPNTLPSSIEIPGPMRIDARILPGQTGGRLGSRWNPFPVHVTRDGTVIPPDLGRLERSTETNLNQRYELLQKIQNQNLDHHVSASIEFQALQKQVLGILQKPSIQNAFDLGQEPDEIRDAYGRDRHGQSTLLARRMLEAGARFITIYWGKEIQDWKGSFKPMLVNNPWDTHRNHFPLIKDSLVPRADRTLAALLEDMNQRGMLDDTLVVWMGEFGRSPRISSIFATPGREHWPHAYSIMLAGAGIRGGHIYGKTDRFGEYVTDKPVSPADLTATILQAIGVDPQISVPSSQGRHQLSQGNPLLELFG